jgi:hypothetical protein
MEQTIGEHMAALAVGGELISSMATKSASSSRGIASTVQT